jgi:hypothetical protein
MRALLTPALGLLAGCAFILGEQTKTIQLVSNPPGAEVAMDGLRVGRAPVSVEILEQADYDFSFSFDGGAVAHCRLSPSWKPYFLFPDILLGGLAGIVIDASLGYWVRQDADGCTVSASQGGAP